MEQESLTLTELNSFIKEILEANFPDELWIVAEISEMNVNARGHCYITFIERDELTRKIAARQRGTVWAFSYRLIKSHFESMTGQPLEAGLKVMVKVKVNYHVHYGLSVNIVDIDPAYTLGEQARHRELILQKLEEQGVIDMNHELPLTMVPQRLAIISSEFAAGYGDFVNQLDNNQGNYHFYYELFPATMQGDSTSASVVGALDTIYQKEFQFDAILIIRGGGAKADLTAFDDYDIAFMVSQSPLPVLTGIGHERDESVTDIVAWQAFKTPTAVATFLIDQLAAFESNIDEQASVINLQVRHQLEQSQGKLQNLQLNAKNIVTNYLNTHKNFLQQNSGKLSHTLKSYIQNQQNFLNQYKEHARSALYWTLQRRQIKCNSWHTKLKHASSRFFSDQYHKISIYQEKASMRDPQKLLKSGYGYVTKEARRISSVDQLQINDQVRVTFKDGHLIAKVMEKARYENEKGET